MKVEVITVLFAILLSISLARMLSTTLSPGISPTVLCTLANIVTSNSMPGILSMFIPLNVKMKLPGTKQLISLKYN